MAIGVTIAFALALARIVGFLLAKKTSLLYILPQELVDGINHFPLMAYPIFILLSEYMNTVAITQYLINVSSTLFVYLLIGITQVNISSSILFAGLYEEIVADTSGLDIMLIPAV